MRTVYYAKPWHRLFKLYTVVNNFPEVSNPDREGNIWTSCLLIADLLKQPVTPWRRLYLPFHLLKYFLMKIGLLPPGGPFLPYSLIRELDSLTRDKVVLEFGSGHSTIYFDKRAKRVVSVESNAQWASVVRSRCSDRTELLLLSDPADLVSITSSLCADADVILVDNSEDFFPRYEIVKLLHAQGLKNKTLIVDNIDNPQNKRIEALLGPPSKSYTDFANMTAVVGSSALWKF